MKKLTSVLLCICLAYFQFGCTQNSIIQASWKGDINLVKSITEKDTSTVSQRNQDGETPLHLASYAGHLGIVKYLILQGADLEAIDKMGETPLHEAAYLGRLEVAKYLVSSGADINSADTSGETILHKSAMIGDIAFLKYIVSQGANVNDRDNSLETPLFAIVSANNKNSIDIVKYLVSQGANVDSRNIRGETALFKAVYKGNLEIAKFLVLNGADLKTKNDNGSTLLHSAVKPILSQVTMDNIFLIEYLLTQGLDIDAQDNMGRTPLHVATRHNHHRIVEYLVSQGADIDIIDKGGNRAIDLAVQKGLLSFQSVLLASDKTSKHIEETKKQIQILKKESDLDKNEMPKVIAQKEDGISDKSVTGKLDKDEKINQLEIKLSNLMNTLNGLSDIEEQLKKEKMRGDRLSTNLEKITQEKEALEVKLESESDITRQLKSSLTEQELALRKKEELVESLYEKERQLKSKLFQLEIAKKQSEKYKKELDALSNRADEMNEKLILAESEIATAGAKKKLDEILKDKKNLEKEANILKLRELTLNSEVTSLSAVAEKTRIEADEAKKEISLMHMRESQLVKQVEELKKRLNREMAPVLVISKPKNGLKIDSRYVMLHLIAVDDKGISKTDVFLNDVPISLDSGRGIKLTAADTSELPKKVDITKRLQIQNGHNTIKVAVVDNEGTTAEEVITIVREKEYGDIWAIVIGINKYQNIRNLKYAVNDATAFSNYLAEYIGISEEKTYFLTDNDATKDNIESILGTQIKRKAGKDDTVIIFYAGHGAVETDPTNPDGDGYEKYLLPYDADLNDLYTTSISMDDIEKIFQRIRAERLIFIADTCYSGASGGRTILSSKTRANLSENFYERISKGKGRVILSSCSANEVSKEDDELKHGIFSYHLLRGLKGEADHDTDGIITLSELFSFLSRKVPDATGQDQHPVRKGETEGELVIGRIK